MGAYTKWSKQEIKTLAEAVQEARNSAVKLLHECKRHGVNKTPSAILNRLRSKKYRPANMMPLLPRRLAKSVVTLEDKQVAARVVSSSTRSDVLIRKAQHIIEGEELQLYSLEEAYKKLKEVLVS